MLALAQALLAFVIPVAVWPYKCAGIVVMKLERALMWEDLASEIQECLPNVMHCLTAKETKSRSEGDDAWTTDAQPHRTYHTSS